MALNALLKNFDICIENCDSFPFGITIYHKCCVPVSLQVEDLKWEVEQRQREIETQKQQLEMVEQCHQREMDILQDTLQVGYATLFSQNMYYGSFLLNSGLLFCLIWCVEDKGGAGDGAGRAQWHTEG